MGVKHFELLVAIRQGVALRESVPLGRILRAGRLASGFGQGSVLEGVMTRGRDEFDGLGRNALGVPIPVDRPRQ
jgi:hypothetical protein